MMFDLFDQSEHYYLTPVEKIVESHKIINTCKPQQNEFDSY